MSFLDRFKPQPKYRNPDPAVRLAGVAELPDDAETLGRHRRARGLRRGRARAARRHRAESPPSAISPGSRGRNATTSLRRELAERLVAMANRAGRDRRRRRGRARRSQRSEISSEPSPNHLRTTRSAPRRSGKFTTRRSSRASRATPSTRRLRSKRSARVTDQAELVAVATKTEHKDAGITALERAVESTASDAERRELLDGIAGRAKNKSVAKRARRPIQEMDDAELARKAAFEQWQKRVALVIARLEAIAAAPGTPDADAAARRRRPRVAGARRARRMRLATRSSTGKLAEARAAIEARRREEAERLAEAERAAARRAAFVALCERVDSAARRRHARRARESARRVGGHARRVRRRSARTPSCARGSTNRAGARPSVTRTARRSKGFTPGSASCRSRPTASRHVDEHAPESAERDAAWRAVADEWQTLAGQADGLDEADREPLCRSGQPRPAPRGRKARRRRADAQAAGAARRTAARARHGARGRRGSDVARGRPGGPRSEVGDRSAAAGRDARTARPRSSVSRRRWR